jgi:hypothetical protein
LRQLSLTLRLIMVRSMAHHESGRSN